MNILEIPIIDPHVHFRDEEWSGKATMDQVAAEGRKVGIEHFFDMPNLPRPVINRQRVDERIQLARDRGIYDLYHLYVGLTADSVQVLEAVDLVDQYDEVAGLKLFGGESTGYLAVADYEEQEIIYQTLSDAGYKEILAVHCEDQETIDNDAWRFNSERPWTWADARSGIAELYSVSNQIRIAKDTDFKGKLQILHVSSKETIFLIRQGINKGLDIGIELTPHHTLYSVEKLQEMGVKKAKNFKCNPSIKNEENRRGLWEYLHNLSPEDPLYYKTYIGSDYAPHEPGAKQGDNPPSGIADYSLYNEFIKYAQNDAFSMEMLKDLLHNNAIRRFDLDIELI